MWVRGLKRVRMVVSCLNKSVAPYVGAWIETLKICPICQITSVAPYVGAWIETWKKSLTSLNPKSRTLYGCVD